MKRTMISGALLGLAFLVLLPQVRLLRAEAPPMETPDQDTPNAEDPALPANPFADDPEKVQLPGPTPFSVTATGSQAILEGLWTMAKNAGEVVGFVRGKTNLPRFALKWLLHPREAQTPTLAEGWQMERVRRPTVSRSAFEEFLRELARTGLIAQLQQEIVAYGTEQERLITEQVRIQAERERLLAKGRALDEERTAFLAEQERLEARAREEEAALSSAQDALKSSVDAYNAIASLHEEERQHWFGHFGPSESGPVSYRNDAARHYNHLAKTGRLIADPPIYLVADLWNWWRNKYVPEFNARADDLESRRTDIESRVNQLKERAANAQKEFDAAASALEEKARRFSARQEEFDSEIESLAAAFQRFKAEVENLVKREATIHRIEKQLSSLEGAPDAPEEAPVPPPPEKTEE